MEIMFVVYPALFCGRQSYILKQMSKTPIKELNESYKVICIHLFFLRDLHEVRQKETRDACLKKWKVEIHVAF